MQRRKGLFITFNWMTYNLHTEFSIFSLIFFFHHNQRKSEAPQKKRRKKMCVEYVKGFLRSMLLIVIYFYFHSLEKNKLYVGRRKKKCSKNCRSLKNVSFSRLVVFILFFFFNERIFFFPYSMMRETFFFFFFAFISSSTPLFFIIDGVWVSAFWIFFSVLLFLRIKWGEWWRMSDCQMSYSWEYICTCACKEKKIESVFSFFSHI